MHIPIILFLTTLPSFTAAIPIESTSNLALPKWTLTNFVATSTPSVSNVTFTFVAANVNSDITRLEQSCSYSQYLPSIYGWGIHQCSSNIWYQLVEDHIVLRSTWKTNS
jgi:hypothetical protein